MGGAGWYHMAPEQLVRYRDAVVEDRTGRPLQDIVDAFSGTRAWRSEPWSPGDGAAGISEGPPRIELLRLKGLVAMKAWPAAGWLGTGRAKTRVADVFRRGGPAPVLAARAGSAPAE